MSLHCLIEMCQTHLVRNLISISSNAAVHIPKACWARILIEMSKWNENCHSSGKYKENFLNRKKLLAQRRLKICLFKQIRVSFRLNEPDASLLIFSKSQTHVQSKQQVLNHIVITQTNFRIMIQWWRDVISVPDCDQMLTYERLPRSYWIN